jgi:light-regulated signal transduction histidine kinase (bacteriophytochrome)
VDVTLGPLAGEGSVSVVASVRDITWRKQLEADLRNSAEELARSNADLEQFAYVASHDLQEPLRAVAGLVQLLQQRLAGKLDERGEEFMHHAVDGARRMQTLISDLLMYSRLSTRAHPPQTIDSSIAVERALANLALPVLESGALVSVEPLPSIVADPTQLTQLFQNLIGNALKYRGDRKPLIRISSRRVDGTWVFSVEDNGIGIEAEYFERIFGVFQRLHTLREYPGTGIGLAICKRIVERHGGRLWVESVPAQGSTFRFTLPDRKGNGA